MTGAMPFTFSLVGFFGMLILLAPVDGLGDKANLCRD
jgi:hypothetical protein